MVSSLISRVMVSSPKQHYSSVIALIKLQIVNWQNASIIILCSSRKHTPPTEGIVNSWGLGGSQRPKNVSECMKLDWNFQRGGRGWGGGGSKEKSLLWGRYG